MPKISHIHVIYNQLKRQYKSFDQKEKTISLAIVIGIFLSTFAILSYMGNPPAPRLKSGQGEVLYSASNNVYSSTIGTKDGDPKISFNVGKSFVGFVLAGSTKVTPKKENNNQVLFPGVMENIDLRYTTTPNGLKEEIILKQAPKDTGRAQVYLFDLLLTGVSPTKLNNLDSNTGNVATIDPTFKDNDGKYLFHFEKPYAVDARGVRTDDVLLQIGEDKQNPGKYFMKLIVDSSWLSDPSRTYPVTIDPTIVHDTTAEFVAGTFNRLKDTGSGSTPTLETYYQELPADQYTVGLWHMNETSDNTCTGGVNDICDKSGNSLDAAATGTTINTTTQRLGNAGRTLSGTEYFKTASSSLWNFGTGAFTQEFWINFSAIGGGGAANNQYITDIGSNGSIVRWYNGSWSVENPAGSVILSYANVPTLNTWHHFAVTRGDGRMNLYLNGNLVASGASTGSFGSTAVLTIGDYGGTGAYGIQGSLDEVRISNIARTPEEIKSSASRRPYSVYTSPVIDFGSSIASWNPLTWTEAGVNTGDGETLKSSNGLVAQWNFNETSGTTADNAEGTSALDGSLSGFDSTASQDADPDSSWTANNRRWGVGALQFDGSNSYVTVSNHASLRPTTITLEAWIKTSSAANQTILDKNRSSSTGSSYLLEIGGSCSAGKIGFEIYNGSSWLYGCSQQLVNDGNWHFVAATYDGTTLYIYIDGKLSSTSTLSRAIDYSVNGTFYIGAYGSSLNNVFLGAIDSPRLYSRILGAPEIMSNYQAGNIELQTRVGADTSPDDGSWNAWSPTSGETAIDSLDSNPVPEYFTVALLHGDNTDASTVVTDSSLIPKTITVAGNAQIDTAQSKFGGSSVLFDGTGDYLSIPDSNDTYFNGDFTIDMWTRFNALSHAVFYDQLVDGNNEILLYYNNTDNRIYFYHYTGAAYQLRFYVPWTPSTSTWYHVALVRSGNTWDIYIDGTAGTKTLQNGAYAFTYSNLAAASTINIGTAGYLNGWIDEARIVKGKAMWTTNFTPSTTAYDSLTQIESSTDTLIEQEGTGNNKLVTGRPKLDGSTVALWHLDETGGSSAYIKDSSSNALNGTPTGTTVVQGVSGKARSFNGSSDYVSVGNSSNFEFGSGNFAVEWWENNAVATSGKTSFSRDCTTDYTPWLLGYSDGSNRRIYMSSNGSAWDIASNRNLGTIEVNSWTHLAVVRSGNNFYAYKNGVQQDSWSSSSSFVANSNAFCFGRTQNTHYYQGKIDEIRITKGTDRSAEEVAESYRSGRDHYINKTISSTDLSGKSSLPFYVAADRPGSYLSATIGESAFANYQPDSNTAGLWHLDEQSGSGAYIKDATGNNNNLSLGGSPGFGQGKIGKARIFSSTNYLACTDANCGGTSKLDPNSSTGISYGAWIYPTANQTGYVISKWGGGGQGYALRWVSGNTINAFFGNSACNNNSSGVTSGTLALNNWYYVVITVSAANPGVMSMYINGALIGQTGSTEYYCDNTGDFRIGTESGGTTAPFAGTIDEVRVDKTIRTATEIRQAYEIGSRTHSITIDFGAKLDSGNLIADVNDLGFTVDATYYGLQNKGDALYAGDKIIVKENVDGIEYIGQGTVTAVTASTGAVTISAWDSGSTFPSGGYTANASVFKWQREYWNINNEVLDTSVDAITNLTLRLTDGSEGRTIYLDDLRSNSSYLTDPTGSTITSSTGSRYAQYRAILSSFDEAVTATLSAVTLDYITNTAPSTPSLDLPTDTATNQILSPVLKTTTTDSQSDYLRYKIELCTNVGMTTGCQTFDQTSSQTGWSGQNAQTSTAYTSGTQATYTLQSPLSVGTTYYWRSYAIDPGGTNTWSSTQTPYSFTTTSAPSSPTTPYAEGASNPTGVTDTTPEFSAIHSDPNSDAANYYEIEVNTNNTFTGTVMWDSGAVSMASLANGVRSTDVSYAGTSIPLDGAGTTYYWRIRFTDVGGATGAWSTTQSFTMNLSPGSLTLDLPTDSATNQILSTVLKTTGTDSNSDYLRYKIELCTNVGMTTGCQTFDQTSSQTGWSGQNAQTSTAYTSGTQATYTLQSPLSVGTTYYWRSYAIDPGGTNTWSGTQGTPYSFTTISAPETASGCRLRESNDDSTLTLIWADISINEDFYEVQRSVDGGAFSVLATGLSAGTTSYPDTGITDGHTYRYRVAPYFSTGPAYGDWCTTSTLNISKGTFKFENINFQ